MLASYVISRTLVPTLVMWFYRNVKLHGEHEDDSHAPAFVRPFIRMQRALKMASTVSVKTTAHCSQRVWNTVRHSP